MSWIFRHSQALTRYLTQSMDWQILLFFVVLLTIFGVIAETTSSSGSVIRYRFQARAEAYDIQLPIHAHLTQDRLETGR